MATVASLQELLAGPTAAPTHLAIQARNALAETPVTCWLEDWAPLPDRQKRLIVQTRLLMANPEARKRLMAVPEIRALAAHSSFYQALEDKKVLKLLNEIDLRGLIDHPKIRAVLADEAF